MTRFRALFVLSCLWATMFLIALPAQGQTSEGGVSNEPQALTFSRLVVRDERNKDLYFISEEYRVYVLDELRRSGFAVRGAENLLFDQDKSAQARFVLGGTVTATECGVDPERPVLCEVVIVWELFDIRNQQVVYKVETRGVGRLRTKKESVAIVLRCLSSLMSRWAFKNALHPREETSASAAASNHEPATFLTCPTTLNLPTDMSRAQQATVVVKVGAVAGSGVLVSSDGVVLTANHVVEALSTATVELKDGRQLPARVIRRDSQRDIAVLRVDAQATPCLPVAASLPREGETLYAIGTPLSDKLSFTVTQGLVSGIRDEADARWIQTDAALNSGNSGGPLLNEQGAVIGLVSGKLVGFGVEGLSFAISSASALAVLSLSPGARTTLPVLAPSRPAPPVSTYVDKPDPHYGDTPGAKERARQEKRKNGRFGLYTGSGLLVVMGVITLIASAVNTDENDHAATNGMIAGGVLAGLGVTGFIVAPIAFRDPKPTKTAATTPTAYGLALNLAF